MVNQELRKTLQEESYMEIHEFRETVRRGTRRGLQDSVDAYPEWLFMEFRAGRAGKEIPVPQL